MAAIVIVVLGLLSTVACYFLWSGKDDSFYVDIGASVINALSILWIIIVLMANKKKTETEFGKAIRDEESTILLMVFVSGAYSILSLLKTFATFPH